jgi:hypothetical protein
LTEILLHWLSVEATQKFQFQPETMSFTGDCVCRASSCARLLCRVLWRIEIHGAKERGEI